LVRSKGGAKVYCVYKHTSPNGKVYIGITGRNPVDRWRGGCGYQENEHFYRAILKYGWNNIKHEILEEGLTREEACKKEVELIAFYDSTNPEKGYNHSIGGKGGKTGCIVSDSTRAKLRETRKRQLPPTLGKKHTEDTKRRMGEAHKDKTCVMCIETGQEFAAVRWAANEMGVNENCIFAVLRGKCKTAGGYHWIKL
jgi:group I intron endonuclease